MGKRQNFTNMQQGNFQITCPSLVLKRTLRNTKRKKVTNERGLLHKEGKVARLFLYWFANDLLTDGSNLVSAPQNSACELALAAFDDDEDEDGVPAVIDAEDDEVVAFGSIAFVCWNITNNIIISTWVIMYLSPYDRCREEQKDWQLTRGPNGK